ncbi:hypothetical protein HMPREF9964_2200 [Streptococcus dysgalactiae subsp. equisimilis SK1249]|nr:hypothetical protein HMPREF9964_2200 [Streptococcus dysgalactiae subsp. equisimilis SK1249]
MRKKTLSEIVVLIEILFLKKASVKKRAIKGFQKDFEKNFTKIL